MMMSRAVKSVLIIAAIGFWSAGVTSVWAEGDDPKALAAALKEATATLQGGLKASEPQGTPISAKFGILARNRKFESIPLQRRVGRT
jgi:hypothetical protein